MSFWLIPPAIVGAYFLFKKNKPKIFVSYYYKEEKNYKNLLKAWDKNREFDFQFTDLSVDVSVKSDSEPVIKRVISRKIKESDYFLCLVGTKTNKRKMVAWEIDKAIELNKKIVVVKTNKSNQSPVELKGAGATWAMSFSFEAINKALKSI